jgi:hypothetical protein
MHTLQQHWSRLLGKKQKIYVPSHSDIWFQFNFCEKASYVTFVGVLLKEITDWCEQNIGPYSILLSRMEDDVEIIEFSTASDAVAFKLRWL